MNAPRRIGSVELPPIDQVGYVVRDLDETNGTAFPHGYGRYALGPVRQVTPPADGWLWAAGELSMTAEDLAKWDIARMNRSLAPAEDWEEQEKTVVLNNGKDSGYGLGVYAGTVDGRRRISHGGESVGFLSTNQVYPAEKAAIQYVNRLSDFLFVAGRYANDRGGGDVLWVPGQNRQ